MYNVIVTVISTSMCHSSRWCIAFVMIYFVVIIIDIRSPTWHFYSMKFNKSKRCPIQSLSMVACNLNKTILPTLDFLILSSESRVKHCTDVPLTSRWKSGGHVSTLTNIGWCCHWRRRSHQLCCCFKHCWWSNPSHIIRRVSVSAKNISGETVS